jgi:hypothetical protein
MKRDLSHEAPQLQYKEVGQERKKKARVTRDASAENL